MNNLKFSRRLGSFPNPEPSESPPTTHKHQSKTVYPDMDLIPKRLHNQVLE